LLRLNQLHCSIFHQRKLQGEGLTLSIILLELLFLEFKMQMALLSVLFYQFQQMTSALYKDKRNQVHKK